METHTYHIHLQPAEEGGYTVTVPALPGCITEGDTYEEALEMAREAISLYLESLIEDGEPIPIDEAATIPLDARISVITPATA